MVGSNSGAITKCYSEGTVTGSSHNVGGLVGINFGGTISKSYSNSAVTGAEAVGGLIGEDNLGNILNTYATGAVTLDAELLFTEFAGGLVGYTSRSTVINSFSVGLVSGLGSSGVHGLIGQDDFSPTPPSTVTGSYWNTETSHIGLSEGALGTGLNTDGMKTAATFIDAGWNLTPGIWNVTDDEYPALIW